MILSEIDIYDKSAVCIPKGFLSAGTASGIKKSGLDIALIVSEAECDTAAVFTKNVFKAAPVKVSQKKMKDGKAKAIVVNSGNANSCTGKQGYADAERMCGVAAKAMGLSEKDVLIASTGVIGVPLPMEKVESGIMKAAGLLSNEDMGSSEAILTTDSVRKMAGVRIAIGGCEGFIGGIAKGAGMIHPDMATMLAFLTSDIKVEGDWIGGVLKDCVDNTFNAISVDGDGSTNDSVFLMMNGLSGNKPIRKDTHEMIELSKALRLVCKSLAMQILEDGEGASKVICAKISGAKTKEDAEKAAKSVVSSNLVKCAVFGADPNWGRIAAAIGRSGADFEPEETVIKINRYPVFKSGEIAEHDEAFISKSIRESDEVEIEIELGCGDGSFCAYGCDLTYEYIKINSEYKS